MRCKEKSQVHILAGCSKMNFAQMQSWATVKWFTVQAHAGHSVPKTRPLQGRVDVNLAGGYCTYR